MAQRKKLHFLEEEECGFYVNIGGGVGMKNKRSDWLFFAVTLAFTVSLFNCAINVRPSAEALERVPLPKDIHIVDPPADLPREIAAFSGKWAGKWDAVLDSVLIVEEISDKQAKIILAHPPYPGPLDVGAAETIWEGYKRILAKVSMSPKPSIEFEIKRPDHPVVTFQMQKDLKTIKGFWVYVSDLLEDHFPIVRITMEQTN